jgi:hypothetical protein
LNELMGWSGPLTHRQYVAWSEFLADEMEVPSRSDYYAMSIVAEIRSLFNKNVRLEHCRLRFRRKGERPKVSKETAAAWSKAAWGARLGGIAPEGK